MEPLEITFIQSKVLEKPVARIRKQLRELREACCPFVSPVPERYEPIMFLYMILEGAVVQFEDAIKQAQR